MTSDNETGKNEKQRNFFVLFEKPSGQQMLGKVSDQALSMWTLQKSHLVVQNPKRLDMTPIPDESGRQIKGFNFHVMPTFPAKTKQERMIFAATSIEVLGEITTENGDDYCTDESGLYAPYKNMIGQWQNELNQVQIPLKQNIITPGRTPNAPIPFRRK